MRLFEVTTQKVLYHGSPQPLKIGKAYRVRQWTKADQGGASKEVEAFLEKHRPNNAIPRNKAFYMTDSKKLDILDLVGASTDYVYQVSPIGRLERHDLQWLNDIDAVMNREFNDEVNDGMPNSYSWHMPPIYNSEKADTMVMLVQNYWGGKKYPYNDWAHWEYLSPSFKVLKLVYEGHDE